MLLTVSVPASFLDALTVAPLPASCLRMVLYFLRLARGTDPDGRVQTIIETDNKTLGRVLDLSHTVVRDAMRALSSANVITPARGAGYSCGVFLNMNVSTWGDGTEKWREFGARLEYEAAMGAFGRQRPPIPSVALGDHGPLPSADLRSA
jgi:hypothetical protein